VHFTFDKSRELKFDIRAVKALELAAGNRPLGTLIGEMRQFSLTYITLAVWAGLRHEDKALTIRAVEDILEQFLKDKGLMGDVVDALIAAFEESGMFRTRADVEREEQQRGNAPTTAVM
jgi:hypothetical protein